VTARDNNPPGRGVDRETLALRWARIVLGCWLGSVVADAALGDAFSPPDGLQAMAMLVGGWLLASHTRSTSLSDKEERE
jgi:hypothetical protein